MKFPFNLSGTTIPSTVAARIFNRYSVPLSALAIYNNTPVAWKVSEQPGGQLLGLVPEFYAVSIPLHGQLTYCLTPNGGTPVALSTLSVFAYDADEPELFPFAAPFGANTWRSGTSPFPNSLVNVNSGDTVTSWQIQQLIDLLTGVMTGQTVTMGARFEQKQGADVAIASQVTLGNDGNHFAIIGNSVNLDLINSTGWVNGSEVTLLFDSNPVVVGHNVAASGAFLPILLEYAKPYIGFPGSTLTLVLDVYGGVRYWRELARMNPSGRIYGVQGADLASANNLVLGYDGTHFNVTGTTNINNIESYAWQTGSVVQLFMAGTPLIRNNQAESGGQFRTLWLRGGVDWQPVLGATLTLVLNVYGAIITWRELARTEPSGLNFSVLAGRIQEAQGAGVASANNLTLGNDGNFFPVSGTTPINLIDQTNWQAGSKMQVWVPSGLTFKHNIAASGAFKPMWLKGAVDFVAGANSVLEFVQLNGTTWFEIARWP